jgi:hypothetical protein
MGEIHPFDVPHVQNAYMVAHVVYDAHSDFENGISMLGTTHATSM